MRHLKLLSLFFLVGFCGFNKGDLLPSLTTTNLFQQGPAYWAKEYQITGAGSVVHSSTILLPNGDSVIAVITTGSGTTIARLSPTGNVITARTYNFGAGTLSLTGCKISLCSNGEFVFAQGLTTFFLNLGIVIMKLDQNLNPIWVRKITDPSVIYRNSAAFNDGIAVVGGFSPQLSTTHPWVACFGPNGDNIFQTAYTSTLPDNVTGVSIATIGNHLVVGIQWSPFATPQSFGIMLLEQSGSFIIAARYYTNTAINITSMDLGSDGLYVSGYDYSIPCPFVMKINFFGYVEFFRSFSSGSSPVFIRNIKSTNNLILASGYVYDSSANISPSGWLGAFDGFTGDILYQNRYTNSSSSLIFFDIISGTDGYLSGGGFGNPMFSTTARFYLQKIGLDGAINFSPSSPMSSALTSLTANPSPSLSANFLWLVSGNAAFTINTQTVQPSTTTINVVPYAP
ncbi:MAG: hypothetical protein HY606_04855 [Planctomycetes bacterium]|nr:hypothetical protein [Planctomycetota bacterium]